jgi:hypothetical protein
MNRPSACRDPCGKGKCGLRRNALQLVEDPVVEEVPDQVEARHDAYE